MPRLSLSCQLSRSHAIVFSDIVVAPFLNIGPGEAALLDRLFRRGHLKSGTYCLAGYPDKGPRAIIKLGKTDMLELWAADIDQNEVRDALYFEVASGFAGDIFAMMHLKKDNTTTVAEVWWFHGSLNAETEWHRFMENLSHQMKDDIFFAPIKPALTVGPIDFRKQKGTGDVTMSFDVR